MEESISDSIKGIYLSADWGNTATSRDYQEWIFLYFPSKNLIFENTTRVLRAHYIAV